eukprot:TRINITY_DN7655_c0_g1_i1.p1 TRINITY_DN7655_c0_g1~~TRINITY_DN7655_c0_g1_i1.p1  ORF type:complete len:120 (-),score=27.50 TRINITY_DN7655_c0_g1_i1:44-403(-)
MDTSLDISKSVLLLENTEKKVSEILMYASNTVGAIAKSEPNEIIENTKNYFSTINEITKNLSQALEMSDDKKININSNDSRESFYISKQKTESILEDLDIILGFSKQYLKENDINLIRN